MRYILNRFFSIYFRTYFERRWRTKAKIFGNARKQEMHQTCTTKAGSLKEFTFRLPTEPFSQQISAHDRNWKAICAPADGSSYLGEGEGINPLLLNYVISQTILQRAVYIHFPASGVVKLNGKRIHVLLLYEDETTKAKNYRES